ncbi:MAG: hypothetical protein M1832_001862 [Thelocarpon impressellum]|nr:MAG: hypothetical protein M1832_001862 [Thelocarpon impressellum]
MPLSDGLVLDGLSPQASHRTKIQVGQYRPTSTDLTEAPRNIRSLRLDADRCWEEDLTKGCFTLRVDGAPRLQLGPLDLYWSLERETVHHVTCPEVHSTTAVQITLDAHHWYPLPIWEMIGKGALAAGEVIDDLPINERPNFFVNAHDSDVMVMMALSCIFVKSQSPHHRIVADCVSAGLTRAEEVGYPEQSVMLILSSR